MHDDFLMPDGLNDAVDGQGQKVIRFTVTSGQQFIFKRQSDLAPYDEEEGTVFVLYPSNQPQRAYDAAGSVFQ